jgi:hypothetical protein
MRIEAKFKVIRDYYHWRDLELARHPSHFLADEDFHRCMRQDQEEVQGHVHG